jgi:serine/threonine protein kinase
MVEPALNTSLIGSQLGAYSVRRLIGEGGMGVVYEGWDERLQRSVAIKAIRPSCDGDEARARLWGEARSLARVSHPGICQVFDVLDLGASIVLILELLDGQSLAQRLSTGMIVTSEAVAIERQILQALSILHEFGIVHRDLKPSNVFLTRHGAKLLDFGLARSVSPLSSPATTNTALTLPGALLGTPQYMSPEQASGNQAGPAADLFSAGCILYEMLSGTCPFEGGSYVDVLYAVMHQEPKPLSGSRAVEQLDHVLRNAMSKRPEDRYPSASEMLEAIETVSLTASTFTSVAAPTRTVVRLIALPFRVLKKDEDTDFLAYSLPDAISSSIANLESVIVRSSAMASGFDNSTDPKCIAAEAQVDAFLSGTLLRAGDQIRVTCQLVDAPSGTVRWSGAVTASLGDLFTTQDELSRNIVQSLMIPLSERERSKGRRDVPASAKAYEFFLRGNQVAADRSLENIRVARDLYQLCVEEDPHYAPGWARLGRVQAFLEKFSGDDLSQAEFAFQRAFDLDPELASAHNLYTPIECDQGRAILAMERLLKRARYHRNDADLFAGLVQACRYCDELGASIAAHERATLLNPQIFTSVSHTWFEIGDYSRTLEFYSKKGAYYLDCAALAAMGENAAALARLKEREPQAEVAGPMRAIMISLRAYLEGDVESALNAMDIGCSEGIQTPETVFYMARHLARLDQPERAVTLLHEVLRNGFLCGSTIRRDPWFDSIRSSPHYFELLAFADERRNDARNIFRAAGGPDILPTALRE